MAHTIYNSLASPDLDVVELIDPGRIQFYADSIANQINEFRKKKEFAPVKQIVDLSRWIADITIETSAQGASLLEVQVIDPAWTMFLRDDNGVCFIDADEDGYLWPPIEVNFPPDVSDAVWRLCMVQPTSALDSPNVTLTFEDKIVAELREHYKPQQSRSNETRAEFIQRLIQDANKNPIMPSDVDIRFVHLLPKETFTAADLTLSQSTPKSATQKNAPPARKNHKKEPPKKAKTTIPTKAKTTIPTRLGFSQNLNLSGAINNVNLSIESGILAITGAVPNAFSALTPTPPSPLPP